MQHQQGWASMDVLEVMRRDRSFWPDCDVCDRPATMHHIEHAGTSPDGPVTHQGVYCDEHSAERVQLPRTRATGPLYRPLPDPDDEVVVEEPRVDGQQS